MLCSMKEMLSDAHTNGYAVPAFDISNYEIMKVVLEVCEEERSPALMMSLECDLKGKALSLMPAMVKSASEFFSVPVCYHLDHAKDFAFLRNAVNAGFSSVMFDGSTLPFDENLAKTREIVEYAHALGLTVEAELGHVGDAMVGNHTEDTAPYEDPDDTLTDPKEAEKFVEKTGVDALAVAVGTSHGVYKKTPVLRINRLKEISSLTNIPLVLHGGSGTPDDQIKEAINNGICKINIFSDVLTALNDGLKESLYTIKNPAAWPAVTFEKARALMKDVIRSKIYTFGSNNRV